MGVNEESGHEAPALRVPTNRCATMDKTNIVNVNRVYEETLKKEATAYRLREDFTLNPKKMNTIPPKPNYVIKVSTWLSARGIAHENSGIRTVQTLHVI